MSIEPFRMPNRALWSSPMHGRHRLCTPRPSIRRTAFMFSAGHDAQQEYDRYRNTFLRQFPHRSPERLQQTTHFVTETTLLQGRLAAVFAVAVIRDFINDRDILAARADIEAVIELINDTFVNAWGPSFSGRARARRARALAHQGRLDYEAALAAHAAALPYLPPFGAPTPDIDTASAASTGSWGTGVGWGGEVNDSTNDTDTDAGGWGSGNGTWGSSWGASWEQVAWTGASLPTLPTWNPAWDDVEEYHPRPRSRHLSGSTLRPWCKIRVLPVDDLRIRILWRKAREASRARRRAQCAMHDARSSPVGARIS
ncbi:hypothetical protein B0H14DRAFT_3540579 [Mycena olivaceomarginata]|nr:hypothetical protein B0H14DRAFT_3540579 [Mycena olivaceomarginata]